MTPQTKLNLLYSEWKENYSIKRGSSGKYKMDSKLPFNEFLIKTIGNYTFIVHHCGFSTTKELRHSIFNLEQTI